MTEKNAIQYLERADINTEAWDNCISQSENGLIYAYSFYLDAMTTNWSGLVLGDYEAVMPLPWRKKYGISYLYQPFLTAQLGLFGKQINSDVLHDFLQAIPQKFRLWDLMLNHANCFNDTGFTLTNRVNYVLSLTSSYEVLYKSYRDNIRRNIKKAAQYGCTIKTAVPLNDIIELAKLHLDNIPEEDYDRFRKLYQLLNEKKLAVTYGVYSKEGNLLASAVFLFSNRRAYYILVGNHPNGRTLGASHALIDAFIRDHAGKELLLDFEGSDLRNLAFFYSSFGAREESYAAIKLNRLPWLLKWTKRF